MSTQHDPAGAVSLHDMNQPVMDGLPIYEVARELGLAQHVMRMWESRFPQLCPLRGQGGRRYYRPHDIAVLRQIADLLYVRKLSVAQAQAELGQVALAADPSPVIETVPAAAEVASDPVMPDTEATPVATAPESGAGVEDPVDAQVQEHAPPVESVTVVEQVTIIEEAMQLTDTDQAVPSSPHRLDEAAAQEAPVATSTASGDATPSEDEATDEDEMPLEQIVMIELERLQAENTMLRDSLRGVLVELQALREMVPV